MTLDLALAQRFTELQAVPPQDIYDAIRFEMVKHKRVMVMWDVYLSTSVNKRIEIVDETELWRPLFDGRKGQQ